MQQPAFFGGTYDEAMTLMVEARNYMSYVEQRERRKVEAIAGLRMSCEAMRVTSRLTQVMAWLMMQRAVHEGEIDFIAALAEPNRLSGFEVCLDHTFGADENLPTGLRSLLERSLNLYQRIARLENQMLQRLN
jgi:regulator of CtrA degradation